MRVRVVQHAGFEEPGTIAEWALERGHELVVSHPYRGDAMPSTDDLDWLVAMGGPMSVHDEAGHPWLRDEKTLIRRAVESGKTVLGVCLGAQLIADVLGARVFRGGGKEIGWFPVDLGPGAGSGFFEGLPERVDAFHWHAETFDIPPGAARLAWTEAYENQAFASGPRVLGMQFHLEPAERNVRLMVERCGDDIRGGRFVQSAEAMLAARPDVFRRMRGAMFRILDNLFAVGCHSDARHKETT